MPLVEYAYNNTVHSSTGKASFEIVEGGKKVPPILHTKDKIFDFFDWFGAVLSPIGCQNQRATSPAYRE